MMSRILVVDDHLEQHKTVRKILERCPTWHTTCVDTAEQAINYLDNHWFDLIISVIDLPKMDGFELLRKVKRDYSRIPFMLLSGHGTEEAAMRALNEGAASYVPEDTLPQQFEEAIRRVLQASEHHAKRERLLECMKVSQSEFVIDNDRALLPTVLCRLQSSLKLFSICDQAERLRARMALEEAVANALFHGNLELSSEIKELDFGRYYALADQRRLEYPFCNRKLYISERLSREKAIFTVRDQGHGFDIHALPDPRSPESLIRNSGRGIVMMHAFMDEVHYNERGNEVTLIKHARRAVAPGHTRVTTHHSAVGFGELRG